jgi:hypothetical protein
VSSVEPALLPALETFPAVVVALGHPGMPHHTLADFEQRHARLAPANRLWYECQFHVAAKRLFDSGAEPLLRQVWDRLRTAEPTVSDEALQARLDAVDPALARFLGAWPIPAGYADA